MGSLPPVRVRGQRGRVRLFGPLDSWRRNTRPQKGLCSGCRPKESPVRPLSEGKENRLFDEDCTPALPGGEPGEAFFPGR
jgi:hypothetical protein